MRKLFHSIAWVVFCCAIIAPQGALGGAFTYTSGIQVQNLEAAPAQIEVTYYDLEGNQALLITDTIPASQSLTYFPLDVGDGFVGSGVIHSGNRIAAIANVLGNAGAAAAAYVAPGQGSPTVLLPLLMQANAGFSTWFSVQNASDLEATVEVAYSDGTQAGPVTLQPGAAHVFDQLSESHTLRVFSAVVTSDQPVTALVIEEDGQMILSYSGFPAGSLYPLLPLINSSSSGGITGAQIQNAGLADTEVTVEYIPVSGLGTGCSETRIIPAQSSRTFVLGAFANDDEPDVEDCVTGARFVGSARVSVNSASQPLAVIVNQVKFGGYGGAFNAFDPSGAGEQVVFPLIMDDNAGYFTGFNVQNIGVVSTTVTCEFASSPYTVTGTLLPGEALNDLQNDMGVTRYVGSAICTGPGGQIVGVLNELGASPTADQLLVYEGINPAVFGPTSETWAYLPFLSK